MLLTVDIGNTNITFGCYEKNKLSIVTRIATDRRLTADQYASELLILLRLREIHRDSFDGAIISSVVPEVTKKLIYAVKNVVDVEPLVLGPGVKNGLNIKIDNPAQLGADMVATAVGAIKKYSLPCFVADLGTATKISVIDSKGVFRGCTIAPGVGISLNALSGGASLLPSLSLDTPKNAIGTNTVTSMQSGIVYGNAEMLDGMFRRLEEELGEQVGTIVATGGYAEDIVRHCNREIIYDENLILDGLAVIFEKNNLRNEIK